MKAILLLASLSFFTAYACKSTSNDSDTKNNGELDVNESESQALLFQSIGADYSFDICTMQLVAPDIVLTAAHCMLKLTTKIEKDGKGQPEALVPDLFQRQGDILFKGKPFANVGAVLTHPEFTATLDAIYRDFLKKKGKLGSGRYALKGDAIEEMPKRIQKALDDGAYARDLAIVQLIRSAEQKAADVPIVTLSHTAPAVGQKVKVVGYGTTYFGGTPTYEKRFGSNVISRVSNELIYIDGKDKLKAPDTRSTVIFPGDSGGMLYDAQSREGLGIASHIDYDDTGKSDAISGRFVNLRGPIAQEFLCKNLPPLCANAQAKPAASQGKETFLPDCKKDDLSAGDIILKYIKGKGLMRRSASKGFSCQINPDLSGDRFYPACSAACPQEKQSDPKWGWCNEPTEYACKE